MNHGGFPESNNFVSFFFFSFSMANEQTNPFKEHKIVRLGVISLALKTKTWALAFCSSSAFDVCLLTSTYSTAAEWFKVLHTQPFGPDVYAPLTDSFARKKIKWFFTRMFNVYGRRFTSTCGTFMFRPKTEAAFSRLSPSPTYDERSTSVCIFILQCFFLFFITFPAFKRILCAFFFVQVELEIVQQNKIDDEAASVTWCADEWCGQVGERETSTQRVLVIF